MALLLLTSVPPSCFADVLYDNGDFDYRTAVNSVRGTFHPADVADDFTLTAPSVIEEIQAKFAFLHQFTPTLDVLVYEYTPQGPGDVVYELLDLDYEASDLGDYLGATSATVTIRGLFIPLEAGSYFLSIRGVSVDDDQDSYWGSSESSPLDLGEGYFRSDYYGFADWVPVSQELGFAVDFSFKLIGIAWP
jgi:hypothetical protein